MRKVATPTLRGLVALAAVIAVALAASPAAMAGCVDDILDDWSNKTLGEKTYPLECYDRALREMPRDLLYYSNAPDAIREAKANAFRNTEPASSGGSNGEEGEGPTAAPPTGTDSGSGGSDGFIADMLNLGPSAADDVPLPLLILALLALLLMGAGAAGLVTRRLEARRATAEGPPVEPPPAV